MSRRRLTRHLGSTILDVTVFSKSQEITQVNFKSSKHAREKYKFVIFCNLTKKTGKKLQNYVKKVDFWLNLHEICGYHGNVKNDRHTIDISKFPQKMNEQLLKVSAS